MNHIYLKANAKINLALDVIKKRDDGYHDLKMLMQSVGLHDTLLIKKVDKFPYKFVCNKRWLPTDDRNIVNRASKLLIERYNIKDGIFIELKKNIPVCAGMGGGSSDCAATLIGMRRLFSLPVSNEELMAIGKELGADVPFCLIRGTALAEGIGERLTPLKPHPKNVFIVILTPQIYVSTVTVFKNLDLSKITERPDINGMIEVMNAGDIKTLASMFCNVLETVTIPMYPIIAEIKEALMESGAMGALMSGSGPTVFGYFDDRLKADAALRIARKRFPDIREAFLTSVL